MEHLQWPLLLLTAIGSGFIGDPKKNFFMEHLQWLLLLLTAIGSGFIITVIL